MFKIKRKMTTSVQFEDHQIEWLHTKAIERSRIEKRRVSVSEINSEALQKAIDSENIYKERSVLCQK